MKSCPQCGGRLARVHRVFLQKLLYSDRFRCVKCKSRTGRFQPVLAELVSTLRFVFNRRTRCPRCESYDVHRLNKRDKIDSFTSNPVALFQAVLGAPLNKCPACRMHYYDWRRPKPKAHGSQRSMPSPSEIARTAPHSPPQAEAHYE